MSAAISPTAGVEVSDRTVSRFDGIQVLRFVASAMVLVAHATIYVHERMNKTLPIWDHGGYGVDIFFVISGFVIVLAARTKRGTGWIGWQEFIAKRFVRIFPLYWFATLLNLAILLALPSVVLHSSFAWSEVVQWMLLIPTFNENGRIEPLVGVGWTLYFEMFFYLTFAMVLFARKNPLIYLTPLLLLIAAVGYFIPEKRYAFLIYFNPLILDFVFGMGIARLAEKDLLPSRLGIPLALLGFALLFMSTASLEYFHVVARCVICAMIVAGFAASEGFWRRVADRNLLLLGAASYSLYLIHPIVGPAVPAVLVKLGIFSVPLAILGSISASIVVAVVLHLYLEQPILDFLNQLVRKGLARQSSAVSAPP